MNVEVGKDRGKHNGVGSFESEPWCENIGATKDFTVEHGEPCAFQEGLSKRRVATDFGIDCSDEKCQCALRFLEKRLVER